MTWDVYALRAPRGARSVDQIPDGYSGPNVSPSSINLHPNGRFIYSQNRGDDSLAMFSLDEASGHLTFLGTVKTGGRGPREMGIEPAGKYLYVCNQQSGDVTGFAIDSGTGRLTQGAKVELPLAGVISGFDIAKTVGSASFGNAWSRRATPRVTWKYTPWSSNGWASTSR